MLVGPVLSSPTDPKHKTILIRIVGSVNMELIGNVLHPLEQLLYKHCTLMDNAEVAKPQNMGGLDTSVTKEIKTAENGKEGKEHATWEIKDENTLGTKISLEVRIMSSGGDPDVAAYFIDQFRMWRRKNLIHHITTIAMGFVGSCALNLMSIADPGHRCVTFLSSAVFHHTTVSISRMPMTKHSTTNGETLAAMSAKFNQQTLPQKAIDKLEEMGAYDVYMTSEQMIAFGFADRFVYTPTVHSDR